MKQEIIPSIRLTLTFAILLSVFYPAALWCVAQVTPDHGTGKKIEFDGKSYYSNIGQSFTDDRYFNSRPSAVAYNAAGSCGSNKGPSNPDYLAEVKARIDTFLVHNPGIDRAAIPSELVTASGSGLDPDISVAAARVQISRIARIRNMNIRDLELLLEQNTEPSMLGLFGPPHVNVLQLNLALDQLNNHSNQ